VWQYCHEDFALSGVEADSTDIYGDSIVLGQSITGGFVYRGRKHAKKLKGQYIFADHETHILGALSFNTSTSSWEGRLLADATNGISFVSTFAEHFDTGELYIVSYSPTSNIYSMFLRK
jgi:hypothetical protein